MVNKRKERPCDSVPADRRCRVCCNPRYKMPCEGPLPETSRPSLADPAAPLSPNPMPLQRRDKAFGRCQVARQNAFMGNFFAPANALTSTMAMEAATLAPAVGYTVEQVRAHQSDRSFRRGVQNLHLQIIELAGEHSQSHAQDEACEALEKLPTKEIDRAQSAPKKAFMRIFFFLPPKL